MGHIVIAKVYGELTVKRLLIQGKKKVLQAENPLFANIDITPHTDIEFIAVVKHCIKKL
jgi:SOS-response transcriptional repressor LexA